MIFLIYHPFRKAMPEGAYAEKVQLLATQAQQARSASYRTHIATSMFAAIVAVMLIFGLLFAYTISSMDMETTLLLLSQFPTKNYQVNCVIYVMVLLAVIDVLCSLLLLVLRPVYRYHFPYDHVIQAERSVILAKEIYQDLSPEEKTIRSRENSATIREEAQELEKDAAYVRAKRMFLEAAICDDVPAMEHYARHCLLSRMNDSADYWLKKAIASGDATPDAKKWLLRLRLRLRPNVGYLHHDAPPLTTRQKVFRLLRNILTVLWRILIIVVLAGVIWMCVQLIQSGGDLTVFEEYSAAISQLFS